MCYQAKKHYEKAFREAERAQEVYKKAEQDINLSKAEIEKVSGYLWHVVTPKNPSDAIYQTHHQCFCRGYHCLSFSLISY